MSQVGGAAAPLHTQMQPSRERLMPLQRVVNIYAVSMRIFKLTRTLTSTTNWADTEFMSRLAGDVLAFDAEMKVLRDHKRLKDWVAPLHFRKTGAVLGAGRRLAGSWTELVELHEEFEESNGTEADARFQRCFKDQLKETINHYWQLIKCIELVVPADFALEVNELARTIRDVVDTASGKLSFVYDDVARICTTTSVRLARLAVWKGIQVTNATWTRTVNDTCFTVSKATKVLHIVGERLYNCQTDTSAFQNVTALTKGVVVQIRKIQSLVHTDPPEVQTQLTFTQQLISEHLAAYDQGIKEVNSSLQRYISRGAAADPSVQAAVNNLIAQLQTVKSTVETPDNDALSAAVLSISEGLENFCGAVYYALHVLPEECEVIKEQIMETMQTAIHCLVLLQLVSTTRNLYYTVVNPEITLLISLRTLLLSVSIVIDGVDSMLGSGLLENDQDGHVQVTPEEVQEAIIYILHYGRPLFLGDDGSMTLEPEFEQEEAPVRRSTVLPASQQSAAPSAYPEAPPSPSNGGGGVGGGVAVVYEEDEESGDDIGGAAPGTSQRLSDVYGSGDRPEVALKVPTNTTPAPATTAAVAPAASSPAPASDGGGSGGGGSGGGGGSADLTASEEELLTLDIDSLNENNLPPNFSGYPGGRPTFEEGGSEEAYKQFMISKYEYETWENKLILWKIKAKKRVAGIKARGE
eukprot:TRINITY_DN12894_c0_g1_i1.p1 TRINITY_DN12894_c0_g1~~TRINITY_DN12894_c0_g1_i1.p1  ORF type:complete len:694 (-),score=154.81 TRINITY_DN12894_c0_g1_i1:174-2255(-)